MALLPAVMGGFGLLLIALVVGLIVSSVQHGGLHPDDLIGIRTSQTRRSAAAWDAGHRAALVNLRRTAVAGALWAVVPTVVALLLGYESVAAERGVLVSLGIGYAVTMGFLWLATSAANAAARAVE